MCVFFTHHDKKNHPRRSSTKSPDFNKNVGQGTGFLFQIVRKRDFSPYRAKTRIFTFQRF